MNATREFRHLVCPPLCTYPSQRGVKTGVVERCPYTRAAPDM